MSSKFSLCFPSGNGNMVCQHRNGGNWIVFPIGGGYSKKQKTPLEVEIKDEVSVEDKLQ